MRFSLLAAGLVPPDVSTACELGFGQGISLNVHAAAEPIAWYGTDFNPSQVSFANEMARYSGARCYADSFQDFCERNDLPDFDYIALHGIWSWIAPDIQQSIVRLIDRKLRPGGVVYISYNTTPGWSAFKPARDLMTRYADTLPAENARQKASDSFAFMEKLLAVGTGFGNANPQIGKRLEGFRDKDSSYLVHEFFNQYWTPCSFAEMADTMAQARVSFGCSAQPIYINNRIGFSPEQREFLQGINDPILRESAVDFIRNTQFRKDYWIKGPRQLGSVERGKLLREEKIILTAAPEKLAREIKTNLGAVTLGAAAQKIFISVLGDGKPHGIGELEKAAHEIASGPDAPEGAERENIWSITQAACVLLSTEYAFPVQKIVDAKVKATAEKLNIHIEMQAMQTNDIKVLASPVTGGGILTNRFEMLFFLAMRDHAKTVDNMAKFARDCLILAGQNIVKDGKPIENPDETLAYLQKQAETFIKEALPIYKNLQIA